MTRMFTKKHLLSVWDQLDGDSRYELIKTAEILLQKQKDRREQERKTEKEEKK